MPITHAFVSAIADDPVAAGNGEVVPSNWNAAHAVDYLTLTHGTITAAQPTLDATATWNNGAVAFTGWKYNVTDTASAAGSLLADLQVGGAGKFGVGKDGIVYLGSPSLGCQLIWSSAGDLLITSHANYQCVRAYQIQHNNKGVGIGANPQGADAYVQLGDGTSLGWSSSANIDFGTYDTKIYRDASGVVAQRYDANAQTFRVYGTYTDASNYVRASLGSTSTAVTLAAETAGSGADDVDLNINAAGVGSVVFGKQVKFSEQTAPSAPAANQVVIYAEDNGGGKTRLMALFSSGAAQQIAIQP